MKPGDLEKLGTDVKDIFDNSDSEQINLSLLPRTTNDLMQIKQYLVNQGYGVGLNVNVSVNDAYKYSFKVNSFILSVRRAKHA
ncbi:MAG TPA: hypothetical protein VMC07_00270 [Candidatus Omnitrophota bacterium]|nr:hypothetical protein [Candidatus Omnitrophota bacterium]